MTKPTIIYLPEMSLTLVRRVSARLPYNHFLFRTTPKWTKHEIKEYLEKVYSVNVARINTSITQGKTRRVMGRRQMFYKLKDYKRVMVMLSDTKPQVDAPKMQ